MKFADLAFGKRDQRYARELEMFVEGRDIGLIARDTVERFRQNDVELACLRVSKQCLNAGTQDHARAGDSCVLIGAHNLPALTLRSLAAKA